MMMAAEAGIETALTTLQPIRDLAKNWDIDIAACLDEYLEDLELSQETREHVAASLNFAQAALVLQNSSGIYSRKVDYLHSYACKVQEELNLQCGEHGSKKSSSKKTGIDAEIEHFLNYDPHQDFLPLNDVLPTDMTETGHKINLPDDEAAAATSGSPNAHLDTTAMLNSASKTRFSIGSLRGSLGNSGSTMLDQTVVGGVNVAAQRALLGTLDTGTLRLQGGACDIGEDGVLRIPGSQQQLTVDEDKDGGAQDMDVYDDDGSFGGGGGAFDDAIDDDDDDGVGFAMADDDNIKDSMVTGDVVADQVAQRKRVTFAESAAPAPVKVQKAKVDPWALLDRDTPDTKKPRPLRIGKTIVLPSTVDRPPSECVTGARTRRVVRSNKRERVPRQPQQHSLITETFSASLGKRALERSVPLKGLAFGNEFAYIARATAKRRAEERRELLRQQLASEDVAVPVEDADDNDGGGVEGFDFRGDYDDEDDFGGGGDAFGGGDEDDGGAMNSNTGIASVDDIYRNREIFADNDSDADMRTFEELCRAHIQAFARGAEKYAAETKLSARVGQWQEKLMPLLEEEEQRPVFDIHAYSNTVIQSMEKQISRRLSKGAPLEDAMEDVTSNIVAFRDVTRDCPPFEVCRMFLAALSLNNSGNIQFTESSLDSLKAELLSSDIERPMATYLAPSVEGAF